MAEAASTKIYISVFNTDESHRLADIKSFSQLCKFLIEKIKSHFEKSDVNLCTAKHTQQLQVSHEGPQTKDDSLGSKIKGKEDVDELSLQMAGMKVKDLYLEKNYLITLSEFCETAAEKLNQLLTGQSAARHFQGHKFSKGDYLASFWSPNWNKIDSAVSDVGKCLAVVLEDKQANNKIIYISVHLPYKDKDKKKAAPEALLQLADELQAKHQPDEIVIAGDFNMKPSKITDIFSTLCASDYTLNMGIASDETETTEAGNSIDNVLIKSISPKSLTLKFVNVDKDDPSPLSHYPIYGVLQKN